MTQGFLWGAATSSHQVEGDNIHNDWWHWENQGRIESKEISGKATDHWTRFEEDLDLAKKLHLNSYRFSIEWSRLEPKEGHWDKDALAWYSNLIAECEKRNLLPMATLHHFTVPKWFYEKGGFTWEHSVEHFTSFVRKTVQEIGSRVPLWCTFNEPMNWAVGKYIGNYMPPARFWPEGVSLASENMLRAHVRAYDLIHSEVKRRQGPWRHHPLMVGIAHNMIDFLPHRDWHPMERLVTQMLRRFYNASWLDAVTGAKQHFGVNGLIPYAKQVPEALGRKTVDFIGVNYYTKAYLRWRAKGSDYELSKVLPIGISFTLPGETKTDMGWAVHPEGLGRILRFVKNYGVPIYITENGIADAKDDRRLKYTTLHLREIAAQIENGIDIRGYYHWSLLDNFEWIKGFGPRFGLIEVNYKSFDRKLRGSASQLSKLIHLHGDGHKPPSTKLIDPFLKEHGIK